MYSLQKALAIENQSVDCNLLKLNKVETNTVESNISNIHPIVNGIQGELNIFRKHGLNNLKKAKLMDRVDTKFVIKRKHLIEIMRSLQSNYSVLSIDGKEISTYENHYFDTHDMGFYTAHHNGKLNRYKIRQRHYIDSKLRFLEVKFKNNKRRTIKSRMKISDDSYSEIDSFVKQSMGGNMPELHIKQISGYQRIAFANENIGERITIDYDVWYQSKASDPALELDDLCIIEIKQKSYNAQSKIFDLLKTLGYAPTSFSKYCIGCALLYSDIKTNRFKQMIKKHVNK